MDSINQNTPGISASTTQEKAPDEAANIPSILKIEHSIRDQELIADILFYPEGRIRSDYIDTCLRIGALALKNAESQIDTKAIRDESERLTSEMNRVLERHRESVADQMTGTLRDYFDPKSGRLNERLEALLKGGGELEQVMSRLIGAEDSQIARTFALHIGESSPIIKLLDPASSSGVISSMTDVLQKALDEDSQKILGEFSMDNKGSALNRFAHFLNESNTKLTGDLQTNIDTLVKEFSLDEENSALSRLVKQVDTAQKLISAEFTLDSDTSALARMRKELMDLVGKGHEDSLKMLKDIHGLVQSLHVRKEEAARSTTHGNEFESALYNLVDDLSQPAGDVATATGNSVGTIRNCKKGDIVVQIGPEQFAAGTNIVIEAKEDASYNIQSALAEIQEARKNRNAEIGIFVFSSKVAPDGINTLQRYGKDILAVWDIDNPDTDLFPQVALTLAKALCTNSASEGASSQLNLEGINESIRDIEKQLEGFDEINKAAETIKSGGERILVRARIMKERIIRNISLLDNYQEDLKELE